MNQRLRTDFIYNLHLLNVVKCEKDTLQMPIIKAIQEYPDELIGFNYVKSNQDYFKGIHFYLDDYQFDRVWNQPEKYLEMIRKFYFAFTPDFSLYKDMPKPLQIYNVYRSRLLGAFWQERGINVIPTLSWSDEESFDFCFKGIEQGGVVTVSTVGIVRNAEAKKMWIQGMEHMIKCVRPKTILIYGKPIEFNYKDIEVIYYDNTNTKGDGRIGR
ncbi:MAG: DUF4417 domain-containing protein [Streptococcaceae bacterium]|nr:DUF4417 domain-containing protein [Streptococcaceae bacterium]